MGKLLHATAAVLQSAFPAMHYCSSANPAAMARARRIRAFSQIKPWRKSCRTSA